MLITFKKIYCVIYYNFRHTYVPYAQRVVQLVSVTTYFVQWSMAAECRHSELDRIVRELKVMRFGSHVFGARF